MIWFRGRKNCQRISENRRIKRSRESGFSLTRYLLWCVYDQRCKDRHKNNNAGDLSGDLIEQFKGLTSEIDFHLLSDNSRDVKDFIVIFTPLVVEFTELSILVWLCFFRPAVFLIAVLEISKRHVFTFLHLPEYPLKIRPLVFRTAAVTSGNMTVNQLGNGIIRDPF